ncbi:hypothetical protein MRX96_033584 [Rhipicephalus microplus]
MTSHFPPRASSISEQSGSARGGISLSQLLIRQESQKIPWREVETAKRFLLGDDRLEIEARKDVFVMARPGGIHRGERFEDSPSFCGGAQDRCWEIVEAAKNVPAMPSTKEEPWKWEPRFSTLNAQFAR